MTLISYDDFVSFYHIGPPVGFCKGHFAQLGVSEVLSVSERECATATVARLGKLMRAVFSLWARFSTLFNFICSGLLREGIAMYCTRRDPAEATSLWTTGDGVEMQPYHALSYHSCDWT